MIDLKEIIRKELITFLNESANTITEKWSISDNIENNMDIVYDTISKDLGKASHINITDDIIAYYNEVELTIFDNKKVTLYYVCYNCRTDESCCMAYNHLEKQNGYEENENYLILTIYLVNGEIIENYSNANIKHELEHILQSIKGKENNPRYKELMNSAYHYASKVIKSKLDNEDVYTNDDYILARLIYYSNSHEQDAFINEYHNELKRNVLLMRMKNSNTHRILKEYKEDIKYFKNSLNDKNLLYALNRYRIFGYTKKNFQIMLDKQVKRFEKKMNNVEKHFK